MSFSIFTLAGCEGFTCAEGTVKDKATNLPLDSVYCEVTSSETTNVYTNSAGNYNVCNRMGGCLFGCKDIVVKFSKSGYKSVIETNPDKGAVIYLGK
jgi:hypothetical protein